MSEYLDTAKVQAEFAEGGEDSDARLAAMLADAIQLDGWTSTEARDAWQAGLESRLGALGNAETIGDGAIQLAFQALRVGFDSPALRQCYIAWFKLANPSCRNFNAAIKAIGFAAQNLTIDQIYRRHQAYKAIAPGTYCYDKAFGRMLITEYDPAADEIIVRLDSRSTRRYNLEFILGACHVIAPKSPLNAIFAGEHNLHFSNRPAFDLMCYQSILGGDAPTPDLIYKIVCKIMNESDFKNLFSATAAKPVATPAANAGVPADLHRWLSGWVKDYAATKAALKPSRSRKGAAVNADTLRERQRQAVASLADTLRACAAGATTAQLQKQWLQGVIFLKLQKMLGDEAILEPIGRIINDNLFEPFTTEEKFNAVCRMLQDNERTAAKDIAAIFCPTILPAWDCSVAIPQLHERLLSNEHLRLTHEPNLEAVGSLLARNAAADSCAEDWANSVALLMNAGLYDEQLMAILKPLAGAAIIWQDRNLYITVTDRMPARLVPCWMNVTRQLVGDDFLIRTTLRLPYNLWGYAENLLKADGCEERFAEGVYDDLAHRRGTPDHFYWLWKAAPKSELRDKYLSDAYMLFRALCRPDLKGNYLKSQRAIVKLMIVPEDKSGNPLPDTENYRFLCTLMKNGDTTAITNLVNCIKQQPLLTPAERQTLLVQITCIYPRALAIVERGAVIQIVVNRYTSPRSLANYRRSYQNLCEVQIPANTRAIEEARSHGDLSENSEYKYAKEHARELNRRKGEMEKELNALEVADLRNVTVGDKAILWSVATIRHAGTGDTEKITILGLYDGDTEKNYISYMAPLGEALLDKRVGDTVTLPAGKEAVIERVEPLPADLVDYLSSEE